VRGQFIEGIRPGKSRNRQILLVLTLFVCYYKKHDVAVPLFIALQNVTRLLEGSKMQNSVTWESLFGDIEADDPEEAQEFWQIVTGFLIPDNISPTKFRANNIDLVRTPLTDLLLDEADKKAVPTPSLKTLRSVGNRPIGYPEWFLAGYPDVVIWAANIFSPMRVSRNEPLAKNTFRDILGNISSENELLDGDRFIKHRYLRALVEAYRRKTGRILECIT